LANICIGEYAILQGNPKKWRLLDYNDFREGYCGYYVERGQMPKPMTETIDKFNFKSVVWFSTKEDEADLYGPVQLKLSVNSALEAYQRMRGKYHKICYRAAGTLVYKAEVNHLVLICCEEDDGFQSFPLITDYNTGYFKPPAEGPTDPTFHITINEYLKKPRHVQRRDEYERHEHVSIAMYLPQSRKLFFDRKSVTLLQTPHKRYCIQSRSNKCNLKTPVCSSTN